MKKRIPTCSYTHLAGLVLATSLAVTAPCAMAQQPIAHTTASTKAHAQTPIKKAKRSKKATTLTPPATVSATTASSGVSARGDFIVAIVDKEAITNREVHEQARLLTEQIRTGILPPPPNRQDLLQYALQQLIFKRAAIQAVRANGVTLSDEELDVAENRLARQAETSPTSYRQHIMATRHLNLNQYRKELADQILLERIREARMREAAASVTDQDAHHWLKQQRPQQRTSTDANTDNLLNLAQVLIAVPTDASTEQQNALQARAQEALRKVQTGTDFALVVQEYTDGFGRDSGGVMGLRAQSEYPPEFLQATANTAIGQNTGLVRSSAGWHILKVIARQQPADSGLVQTEHHVRHILLRPSTTLSPQQAVQRLTELHARITTGKLDFANAARQYSHDGSAGKGGDLGWNGPGIFVPEFEEALIKLQPGEVSPPVASRFGFHLIQLLNRKTTPLSQEQELAIARRTLGEQKAAQALQQWEDELRRRTYIEMREQPR